MPRYRSRVAKAIIKKAVAKKKKGGKKAGKKAGVAVSGGNLSSGGKISSGGSTSGPSSFDGTGCEGCPEGFSGAPSQLEISSGSGNIATGGQKTSYNKNQGGMLTEDVSCQQGGVIRTAGTLKSGGKITSGGKISTGGRLSTGGKIDFDKTNKYIDEMNHEDAYHILGEMDSPTYHTLQGLGSAFLPTADHPLREPYIKHCTGPDCGGAFKHPSNVSKVATADLLKAGNPRHLARMMYSEWKDKKRGLNVGGGLLDSLKSVFKKGIKGLKSGSKVAYNVGKKLHSALERGIVLAEQLAGPLAPLAKHLPKVNVPGVGKVDIGSLARVAVEQAGDVSRNLGTVLDTVEKVGRVIG